MFELLSMIRCRPAPRGTNGAPRGLIAWKKETTMALTLRRPALTVPAALLAVCLVGCSQASSGNSSSGASPSGSVQLTNCGEEKTYGAPVNRIVATSNSANIGTLLSVGASDQIAAMSLNTNNDEVFQKLYGVDLSGKPRLQSPISLESIVAQNPDLLIGSYSGLFSGSSGVTPDVANSNGIATYVISDSCRQNPSDPGSELGTMGPWDAVRTDLTNYGTLTGHEQEAQEKVADLNTRLDALEAAPRAENTPKVLLFDSGTDDLYTSGGNGAPQGIIEAAGGQNVFADQDTTWFHASWESVAQAQPDVIVVMDYRSDNTAEVQTKLDTLRNEEGLKDLPVIRENRIVVLPLALFTSGAPNIDAAESLRQQFDALGLTPQSGITGAYGEYGR